MKKWSIALTVLGVALILAGLGVLIWWMVVGRYEFWTVLLSGAGFGPAVTYQAAITRIRGVGDMFWIFYPSERNDTLTRPTILWLDGVTGLPPSLLANFAMFGPVDLENLQRREDSWVDDFNLLFVDAPLGTGFSTANRDSALPRNIDESTNHLILALESFYTTFPEYQQSPFYIFGQGDGAKLALSTAIRIIQSTIHFNCNIQGVVLGNGVVAPSQTLDRLGFYLDEMGYIDPAGRRVVEEYTNEVSSLVAAGNLGDAFDKFLGLGEFINEEVGTVAVNLGYLLQKLTREPSQVTDYFGHNEYVRSALQIPGNFADIMNTRVADAIGVSSPQFDQGRDAAIRAIRDTYMASAVDLVDYILQSTSLSVTIYNGNMDAISTTPGQLDWVNNLRWSGIASFNAGNRQALVVDGLLHGYYRETSRFSFYWMNAAGISVPLDSPTAMRTMLRRCCGGQ